MLSVRADIRFALMLAGMITVASLSACRSEGHRRATPPRGLLPSQFSAIHVGMSIEELKGITGETIFTPYDGLHARINNDPSGFRRISFSTGEPFPEQPPPANAEIQEIRLAGDTVSLDVIARIGELVGGIKPSRRCTATMSADIFIWQPDPPMAGIELTVSRNSPHRATLRLFSGSWRETLVDNGSTLGNCGAG